MRSWSSRWWWSCEVVVVDVVVGRESPPRWWSRPWSFRRRPHRPTPLRPQPEGRHIEEPDPAPHRVSVPISSAFRGNWRFRYTASTTGRQLWSVAPMPTISTWPSRRARGLPSRWSTSSSGIQVARERSRRRVLRSGAGRGVRAARAERRGEDDDRRHATTRVRPTAGAARLGGVDSMRDPVRRRRQSRSCRNGATSTAGSRSAKPDLPRGLPRRPARELDSGRRDARAVRPARPCGQNADFFSGGQSQRAMIARALMHAPLCFFLDGRRPGLDPAAPLFAGTAARAPGDRGHPHPHDASTWRRPALLADKVGSWITATCSPSTRPPALIYNVEAEGKRSSPPRIGPPTSRRCVAALAGVEKVETSTSPRHASGRAAARLAAAPSAFLPDGRTRPRCASRRRPRSSPQHELALAGRQARHTDSGGCLHPPHRGYAAVNTIAAPALEQGTQWRALRLSSTATSTSRTASPPAFLAQVILQPCSCSSCSAKMLKQPPLH